MIVDKAGCYDAPFGIDGTFRLAAQLAELHDLAVLDGDVALERRHPRAVDDASVLDQQVIRHRFPFLRSGHDTRFLDKRVARRVTRSMKNVSPCPDLRRSRIQRKTGFLGVSAASFVEKQDAITTACTQNSLLSGTMEFFARSTEFRAPSNRRAMEFPRWRKTRPARRCRPRRHGLRRASAACRRRDWRHRQTRPRAGSRWLAPSGCQRGRPRRPDDRARACRSGRPARRAV